MPLDPSENLERVQVQLSKEQIAWAKEYGRRLGGTRSLSLALRHLVIKEMDAEQRQQQDEGEAA